MITKPGEFTSEMTCSEDTYYKLYKPFSEKFFIWKSKELSWFADNILLYEKQLLQCTDRIAKIKNLKIDDKQEGILISQERSFGLTLNEIIKKPLDLQSITLFDQLFQLAKKVFLNGDIAIDLNLSNFIIEENGLIRCVDLTPPLLKSAVGKPCNLLQEFYLALCFNIEAQIYELMCNIFRNPIINNEESHVLEYLNRLLDIAFSYFSVRDVREDLSYTNEVTTGINRPLKRFAYIYQYLTHKIDKEEMIVGYKSYSLKNF